ncbi:MAG: triple tyrosine motif-containing protein [Bacteroidota bacterium]
MRYYRLSHCFNSTTSLVHSLLLVALVFAVVGEIFTQENRFGIPETVNYAKDEYRAGTQNWAITQDDSGLVIFGNNKGVLVFDGSDWELVPLPNRTIVRSLAKAPDGRIYVGGQDEFGYLDRDDCQQICYRSLSHQLPEMEQSFEDVWKIFVGKDEVFFCTHETLFRWDGQRFDKTPAQQRFENFFWLDEQLYAQDIGTGLQRWTGNSFELVPEGQLFVETHITAILPRGESILIVTDLDGLYQMQENTIVSWEVSASQFLRLNQAYCAIALKDGNMAIGTVQNGLVIMDQTGNIVQHINKAVGLQNNTVLSLFQDNLDNFWLAADNGIDYVKISTPFSLIGDYLGIDGTGYSAIIHEGLLFLATNQGLFTLDWPVRREGMRLPPAREVGRPSGQIWGFSKLDESLLINAHTGLFEWNQGQLTPLFTSEGSWKVVSLPKHPNLALEGGYTGLRLYTKNTATNRWQFSHRIEGFDESARVFEVDEDGYIWVSHAYKGLFRLRLINENRETEVKFYGRDEGLPGTISLNVLKIENDLIATTPEGAYRYNSGSDQFEPFTDLNNLLDGVSPIARLLQDADGRLWFSKAQEFGYFELQQSGFLQEPTVERVYSNHLQEYLVDGFEHVSSLDSNNLLIATEKGFISYHPQEGAKRGTGINVLIREASLVDIQDSILYSEGLQSLSTAPVKDFEIHHSLNGLRFRFAAPFYEQTDNIQYRHRLLGYQEEWSAWRTRKEKEYTNLPAGDYVFMVQARNSYNVESESTQFAFTILPAWYASIWARLLYALLGVATVIAMMAYNARRLSKQHGKIVAKQAEEFAQTEARLQEEKEQSTIEINRLRSEKLEADIQHQTSQLASATMHLVQKGEVLLKIKKELTKILQGETIEDNRRKLQRIIHTIDGNTRLDSNWEQFEIYFDQVHKNFLRNLREKYPDLTPKDQKLCAYLRMNLTTKEIAPLMNISVRGVEISRYRLRKKLQLDTDTNLTDFIMRF